MQVDMNSVTGEELQGLVRRLQELEMENNRLRAEVVRPSTPVAVVQNVERTKIDYKVIPRPEKYSGERSGNKVREFSRKVRRYLKCLVNVDSNMYLDIVAGFLTGPADTWFNRWEKNNQGSGVDQMLKELVDHFSPSNLAQEARRKLSTIKQLNSVRKYSEKFREYLEDIEEIEDLEAKTYFINGLKDQIKKEVRLKDLDDVMSLDDVEHIAMQVDSILYSRDIKYDSRNRTTPSSNGISPMQGVQFGNLSLEEVKKYSQERRCWKCHQQNRHAPNCNSKYQFKVNSLESVPQESVEAETEVEK
jgi:hypothetical protein